MKTLILLGLFVVGIESHAKSVLGLKCGTTLQSLSGWEGRILNDITENTVTAEMGLKNFFSEEPNTLAKSLHNLSKILTSKFHFIDQTPDNSELLFKIPSDCKLVYLAKWVKNKTYFNKKYFSHLAPLELNLLLLELALSSLSDKPVGVGIRSLSYKIINQIEDYSSYPQKIRALRYAGISYLEYQSFSLDLNKEIQFKKDGLIHKANPIKNSRISFGNQECKLAENRKIIFSFQKAYSFIPKENCQLNSSGIVFTSLKNHPIRTDQWGYVESFYFLKNTVIKTEHYQLSAVGQANGIPPKIYLSRNKINQLIGMSGKVYFHNKFYDIVPYTNIGFTSSSELPQSFVLKEKAYYESLNTKLYVSGIVRYSPQGFVSAFERVYESSKIHVQGKWVPLKGGSKLRLHLNEKVQYFVPATPLELYNSKGEISIVRAGEVAYLDSNELLLPK